MLSRMVDNVKIEAGGDLIMEESEGDFANHLSEYLRGLNLLPKYC